MDAEQKKRFRDTVGWIVSLSRTWSFVATEWMTQVREGDPELASKLSRVVSEIESVRQHLFKRYVEPRG